MTGTRDAGPEHRRPSDADQDHRRWPCGLLARSRPAWSGPRGARPRRPRGRPRGCAAGAGRSRRPGPGWRRACAPGPPPRARPPSPASGPPGRPPSSCSSTSPGQAPSRLLSLLCFICSSRGRRPAVRDVAQCSPVVVVVSVLSGWCPGRATATDSGARSRAARCGAPPRWPCGAPRAASPPHGAARRPRPRAPGPAAPPRG